MPNKLRQADPTLMNRSRVRRGLARLRQRFVELRRTDVAFLRQTILKLFEDVFRGLSKPRYTYQETFETELPTVERWNGVIEDIHEDLQTLYDQRVQLGELSRLTFNYNQVLISELTERATATASKVIDLRMISGQLQEHAIVGGDDFNDGTRIDHGFAREYPEAEIVPNQGVVTLRRIESLQVLSVDDEVTVNPITPGVDREEDKTRSKPNLFRFYEGHFYDYIGRSRPEGLVWNLEEQLASNNLPVEGTSITELYADPNARGNDLFEGTTTTTYNWGGVLNLSNTVESSNVRTTFPYADGEDVGSAVPFNGFTDMRRESLDDDLRPGEPIRARDVRVVDLGATEEEKNASRKRMVDGNADTFWECEYAVPLDEPSTNSQAGQIFSGNPIVSGRDGYDLDEDGNPIVSLVTADKIDLDVEVVIRLGAGPQKINFITLNPYQFEHPAWVEVLEVATAPHEDAPFEVIPGFDQGLFHNTITDEANEELEEGVYKATLAPTRYSYRGQGVWTFPVREVAKIRFRLRQRDLIPSDYQVLNVQLRRTLTRSVNAYTVIREDTRLVKLTYLQTVQALDDRQFLEDVAGTTPGGSSSGTSVVHKQRWYEKGLLSMFFGSGSTETTTISHNDSGWQIVRSWLQTMRNVARYAIGVRDIGAFGYRYSESSELVSVPFSSPRDILKVQLKVDQYIPEDLSIDRQWIQYYISVDDGQTWLPINPLDHPTAFGDDGSIVPYTYTFNMDTQGPQADGVVQVSSNTPVRKVRFRAVFRTDSTLEDGDRISPILKSYRVMIYPKGGLTDAGY